MKISLIFTYVCHIWGYKHPLSHLTLHHSHEGKKWTHFLCCLCSSCKAFFIYPQKAHGSVSLNWKSILWNSLTGIVFVMFNRRFWNSHKISSTFSEHQLNRDSVSIVAWTWPDEKKQPRSFIVYQWIIICALDIKYKRSCGCDYHRKGIDLVQK